MSRAARVVSAAVAITIAIVPFVAPAHAGTGVTLVPTAEAWYQPNPTCASPAGCGVVAPPPASPYPAGTLHVGVSAGVETARSYLALPFGELSGTASAASLTVPLDIATTDGGSSPAAAKVKVCLIFDTVTPVEGSFGQPPPADCTTSAPADYVATPQPHLDADLAPLLGSMSSATGLALVPDLQGSAPTDTWRVVFSAHDRAKSLETTPATVAVVLEDDSTGTAAGGPTAPLPDSGSAGFGVVEPPIGTGFAAPASDFPTEEAAPPAVSSPPRRTAGQAPSQIVIGHYRYPVVWLFPLLLLVLVSAVSGALTKDLTVSKQGAARSII